MVDEVTAPFIRNEIPQRVRRQNSEDEEQEIEMQNFANRREEGNVENSDIEDEERSVTQVSNNRGIIREANVGRVEIDREDVVDDDRFLKAIYNKDRGEIDDEELQIFIQRYLYDKAGSSRSYNLEILEDIFHSGILETNTMYVEDPITGTFSALSNEKTQIRQRLFRQKTKQNINEENRQLENIEKIDSHPFEHREIQLGSKVLYAPPAAPSLLPDAIQLSDSAQREEWVMVTMEYRNFAFFKRLIFLFFQGLYAGFTAMTVFAFDSAQGNSEKFLQNYQPVAQNTRRYLFVLSSIVVVGSIDCAWTLSSQSYRSKHYFPNAWPEQSLPAQVSQQYQEMQQATLLIAVVISIVAFISYLSVLIMSPFDVMVAIKNGFTSEENSNEELTASESNNAWITAALDDEIFNESYTGWKACNRLRFATAVVAWAGTVGLLFIDISRFTKLWLHIRSMRQTALSWMKRAKALEGAPEELQTMNPDQLREAITILESGLQKVRSTLAITLEKEEQYAAIAQAAARRKSRARRNIV